VYFLLLLRLYYLFTLKDSLPIYLNHLLGIIVVVKIFLLPFVLLLGNFDFDISDMNLILIVQLYFVILADEFLLLFPLQVPPILYFSFYF
jgi:hypothetical protein